MWIVVTKSSEKLTLYVDGDYISEKDLEPKSVDIWTKFQIEEPTKGILYLGQSNGYIDELLISGIDQNLTWTITHINELKCW